MQWYEYIIALHESTHAQMRVRKRNRITRNAVFRVEPFCECARRIWESDIGIPFPISAVCYRIYCISTRAHTLCLERARVRIHCRSSVQYTEGHVVT